MEIKISSLVITFRLLPNFGIKAVCVRCMSQVTINFERKYQIIKLFFSFINFNVTLYIQIRIFNYYYFLKTAVLNLCYKLNTLALVII